jgi:hypothetical protein
MDNDSNMKFYIDDIPFYKKVPVIGIVILVLLLAAWVFRWDYRITETLNDDYNHGKVVHKVDRWTGHHWEVLYGSFLTNTGWEYYSGKEVPFSRSGEMAEGKEKRERQVKFIQTIRTGTTVIWFVFLTGTLGFIVNRIKS